MSSSKRASAAVVAARQTSIAALVLAAVVLAGSAASSRAADCDEEGLCAVTADKATLGEYRYRAPEGAAAKGAGKRPALVFIHGWRGSSKNVIRKGALRRFADEIGAALIAPEGLSTTWSYRGSPVQERDEMAYFDALRRNLVDRHDVDPERILIAGFSMGASMAWSLACARGADYWGFIAFSGAFWEPFPRGCDKPARRLIHIHGEADKTVPIAGRPIGGRWRQGDVRSSLRILAEAALLAPVEARSPQFASMRCSRWENKARSLEFCRHKGGHWWRGPWLSAAYRALGKF